jgi:hypothetical protein
MKRMRRPSSLELFCRVKTIDWSPVECLYTNDRKIDKISFSHNFTKRTGSRENQANDKKQVRR